MKKPRARARKGLSRSGSRSATSVPSPRGIRSTGSQLILSPSDLSLVLCGTLDPSLDPDAVKIVGPCRATFHGSPSRAVDAFGPRTPLGRIVRLPLTPRHSITTPFHGLFVRLPRSRVGFGKLLRTVSATRSYPAEPPAPVNKSDDALSRPNPSRQSRIARILADRDWT